MFVSAADQAAAEALAHGFLPQLERVTTFQVKLVQSYWKIEGQYEVLLEAAGHPGSKGVISRLVLLLGRPPQHSSETEAIWSETSSDFPLTSVTWAHIELSPSKMPEELN